MLPPSEKDDFKLLAALAQGLAGGGPVPRSRFVFDALLLPEVINEMAAQAVLNNMDRCVARRQGWLVESA